MTKEEMVEKMVLINLVPFMHVDPKLKFHTFKQEENIYNHKEEECPKCELQRLINKWNGK